jgi:hypothetical protein
MKKTILAVSLALIAGSAFAFDYNSASASAASAAAVSATGNGSAFAATGTKQVAGAYSDSGSYDWNHCNTAQGAAGVSGATYTESSGYVVLGSHGQAAAIGGSIGKAEADSFGTASFDTGSRRDRSAPEGSVIGGSSASTNTAVGGISVGNGLVMGGSYKFADSNYEVDASGKRVTNHDGATNVVETNVDLNAKAVTIGGVADYGNAVGYVNMKPANATAFGAAQAESGSVKLGW